MGFFNEGEDKKNGGTISIADISKALLPSDVKDPYWHEKFGKELISQTQEALEKRETELNPIPSRPASGAINLDNATMLSLTGIGLGVRMGQGLFGAVADELTMGVSGLAKGGVKAAVKTRPSITSRVKALEDVDAQKMYNEIPFDETKYTSDEVLMAREYQTSTFDYKNDPDNLLYPDPLVRKKKVDRFNELRDELETGIKKQKGGEFPIIRHNQKQYTPGEYEPDRFLGFSVGKGSDEFGPNRLMIDKPADQSYLPTNRLSKMSTFADEREIVLPRKLKYHIEEGVENEFGGLDYVGKILNPYTIVGAIGGKGLYNYQTK